MPFALHKPFHPSERSAGRVSASAGRKIQSILIRWFYALHPLSGAAIRWFLSSCGDVGFDF
ncbi:MAG: hypothetical protein LAT83_04350 [Kiritimatiellae bacterium]|nr:hypothetical protein [Kiritimatiellia bacterium]